MQCEILRMSKWVRTPSKHLIVEDKVETGQIVGEDTA